MINRLMVSVAALALITGTGFANAQGTGASREAPSAGSSAQQQQSAPSSEHSQKSSSERSQLKPTQSEQQKSTQSEQQKSPAAGKNQRTEEIQGQKSKSTSSESDHAKGSKDMKAEDRERGNTNAEQKSATEQRGATESRSQTTVGQAGAGAKLNDEQRTKITTVIKGQHIAPVDNANFSVSVGTRVPRGVTFHPLPAEIVSIYPDWRGYEFILVRDEIVVVNPRTLEIVAVLPA